MKLTVVGATCENVDNNYISNLEVFSGKMAAVCYLNGEYFNSNADNPDKAKSRFDRVVGTGHDSVSDHAYFTVLFENIPKMTAMILNSLGFYNTSEKSGRYTVMSSEEQANTENERLYHKWLAKFKELITKYDQNLADKDPKLVEKLSMENARYVLSVFAPNTTMSYTTSLRMWSYLIQWCKEYLEIGNTDTNFNKMLHKCVNDLYINLLSLKCFSDIIKYRNTGKPFTFLSKQVDYNIWETDERYEESYLIKYRVSLADLAQEQRHRTLDYFMCFDDSGYYKNVYYVPDILKDAGTNADVEEWLNDLQSVHDTFPIATLVDVVETGFISNFMRKCDERLCGRTMHETFVNIRNNLLKFERSWHKSPFMVNELKKHFRDGKVIMKCGNTACKEPCYWGPTRSQNKSV